MSPGLLNQRWASAVVLQAPVARRLGARPGQDLPWALMSRDGEWRTPWHSAETQVLPPWLAMPAHTASGAFICGKKGVTPVMGGRAGMAHDLITTRGPTTIFLSRSSQYLLTSPVAMPRTIFARVSLLFSPRFPRPPSSGPNSLHSSARRFSSSFVSSRPLKRPYFNQHRCQHALRHCMVLCKIISNTK